MESGVLPGSTAELNLLLEWPDRRTGRQWLGIFAGSILFHLCALLLALQLPSLLGQRIEPENRVIVQHIPLYMPPDLMTQREPKRGKVSKQIDLADLTPSRASRATTGGRPSVRRFELPKQPVPVQTTKNSAPQILPQAPPIEASAKTAPAAGSPAGLPVAKAPPPPKPPDNPFQDIGDSGPLNPHPTLAAPKATVDEAVKGLVQQANSQRLAISDDVPDRGAAGTPGALEQAPAQHAAVELETDANGADFKAYLQMILQIVRGNWKRVIPESARMGTLRGRTVVEFIIDRDGNIPKLVIADPSGSAPLDRAAVAGLSMSNRLPPLPAGYKGYQVRLAFTFAYNMPTQ